MTETNETAPQLTTEVVVTNPENTAIAARTSLFVASVDGVAAPDFMQGEIIDYSRSRDYVRPPQIKIVQGSSAPELKQLFHAGSVVATPNNILVSPVILNSMQMPSDDGEPFEFVPIFFYTEYCLWNPIQMRGKLPAVRDRSFDKNSKVGTHARSFIKEMREFPCPENPALMCRFQEHINFIMMPLQGDMYGTPAVQSYSRTSFKAGKALIALWQARKAPMYGCIFRQNTKLTTDPTTGNAWYTPVNSNPLSIERGGSGSWIQHKELYDWLKATSLEFEENYKAGLLRVDDLEDVEDYAPNEGGEIDESLAKY